MAEVKLIRMSSGEDIIATLLSEDGGHIIIKDAIVAIPTSQGTIGFAPWSPLLSKNQPTIKVSDNFVVYIAEAEPSIIEQYNTMFGNVIAPNRKIII